MMCGVNVIRLGLAVAALCATLAGPAHATPTPVAGQQQVNPESTAEHAQFGASVGIARDGRFAVLYQESPFSGNPDVFVQRYDAALTRVGDRIPVLQTASYEQQAALAMGPDGRFAVALLQRNGAGNFVLKVQRFAADGAEQGPALTPGATTVNMSGAPGIAMAADGGIAVAWTTSGVPQRLMVRRYDGAGVAMTGELEASADRITSDARPTIGMVPDGRFALAWHHSTLVDTDGIVPARRYQADGTPAGPAFEAFHGERNRNYPGVAVAMAPDGTLVVGWVGQDSDAAGIFARRFAPGGDAGPVFGVNDYTTYAQSNVDFAFDDDGSLFAVYEGQVGTEQWSYLREFAPDGAPTGNGERTGSASSGTPMQPQVAVDGNGRLVTAWTAYDQSSSLGVFLRRFDYAPVAPSPAPPGPGPGPGPAPDPPVVGPDTTPTPAGLPSLVAPPAFSRVVTLPSTRRCASRRAFKIRLRIPRGSVVNQATVKVNGSRVAVRRGSRLRSTVDLRTLPKGRFTVAITLDLADGRTVSGTRRYRTCVPKRKGTSRPRV